MTEKTGMYRCNALQNCEWGFESQPKTQFHYLHIPLKEHSLNFVTCFVVC